MATTPSTGTLNGRRPGDPAPAGDGEGDGLAAADEAAAPESPGELLGLVTVVPNGVGPGGSDVPGAGVAVAGMPVGFGVGLTVGLGVALGGGGTGVEVGGGGAVTTMGLA